MTTNEQATRPDWTAMRLQDFDTAAELTLFDVPTQPIVSTGDDLLSLLDA